MNICSQSDTFIKVYGDEKGIKLFAKAGFESIDFSMFYPVDKGILAEPDDVVRASSILGANYAIVHPAILRENRYGSLAAENKAVNVDLYSRLIPYLDEYGIKIAIENMFNYDPIKKCICPTVCSSSEEMADYVDTMNSLCKNGDRFVACLDVGHANLAGDKPIGDMVRTLGSRLKSLHIHDNNGINDEHTAPGFGNIKFDEFCAALKEIGYDGDFIFEADSFYDRFDKSLTYDAGSLLYKIGRNIAEKYSL